MIEDDVIKAAKNVDINKVIDYFQWTRDVSEPYKILCPSIDHNDKHPGVVVNSNKNTCRCYACDTHFDTIAMYQALSEKVNGRKVVFPIAVKEILELDGIITSPNVMVCGKKSSVNTEKTYDKVLKHSKPLNGYTLNYLHKRGICLYDSYIYGGKVYTKQSIEKELQSGANKQRSDELQQVVNKGTFFKGIAPILKANKIKILHNYYQGVNYILYCVSYDCSEDEELQENTHFLVDTERNMVIKKSMDSTHWKQALGEADFCFITEGMDEKGDIYICEGMEDGLSYVQNQCKAISLNSVANVKSLIEHLEHHHSRYKKNKLIISLDHDEAGEKATQKLVDFFEAYNQQHPNHPYQYGVCQYPQQFHDINDYWVSKIKEM